MIEYSFHNLPTVAVLNVDKVLRTLGPILRKLDDADLDMIFTEIVDFLRKPLQHSSINYTTARNIAELIGDDEEAISYLTIKLLLSFEILYSELLIYGLYQGNRFHYEYKQNRCGSKLLVHRRQAPID